MKATKKYFPVVYLHKVALVIGVSPTETYKVSPLDTLIPRYTHGSNKAMKNLPRSSI